MILSILKFEPILPFICLGFALVESSVIFVCFCAVMNCVNLVHGTAGLSSRSMIQCHGAPHSPKLFSELMVVRSAFGWRSRDPLPQSGRITVEMTRLLYARHLNHAELFWENKRVPYIPPPPLIVPWRSFGLLTAMGGLFLVTYFLSDGDVCGMWHFGWLSPGFNLVVMFGLRCTP